MDVGCNEYCWIAVCKAKGGEFAVALGETESDSKMEVGLMFVHRVQSDYGTPPKGIEWEMLR
jgi:hypothetical protein